MGSLTNRVKIAYELGRRMAIKQAEEAGLADAAVFGGLGSLAHLGHSLDIPATHASSGGLTNTLKNLGKKVKWGYADEAADLFREGTGLAGKLRNLSRSRLAGLGKTGLGVGATAAAIFALNNLGN